MAYQGVHTFDPSDDPQKSHTEYSPYEAYELQPGRKDPSFRQSDIERHPRQQSGYFPPSPDTVWYKKRSFAWRFGYVLAGIVLITGWIVVMLAFASQEEKYAFRNGESDAARLRHALENPNAEADLLPSNRLFVGALRQFDIASRTLTIQWSGATLSSADNKTLVPFGTPASDEDAVHYEMAIYQDVSLVPDPDADEKFPEGGPWKALSNRTAPRIGTLGLHEWQSFNTEVDLMQQNPGDVWSQPLFGYPWDRWAGSIVLVANMPTECNRASNLSRGCTAFTFDGVSVHDSILNWKIQVSANDTCSSVDLAEGEGCQMHINFEVTRPAIVIFCVLVVVIVNWLSTLAIFLLTMEAVIMKRTHVLDETDILGVCFSALFALPSVRSLLPAAPDFAAIIDLVGILPNVIVISLCTTAVAGTRIAKRMKLKQEAAAKLH